MDDSLKCAKGILARGIKQPGNFSLRRRTGAGTGLSEESRLYYLESGARCSIYAGDKANPLLLRLASRRRRSLPSPRG